MGTVLPILSEDISESFTLLHKRIVAMEQWIRNPPIPVVTSDRRDLDDDQVLSTAKALFDHTGSDDHDARYYEKSLIDGLLTSKVNIADIVDDTNTQDSAKALSAKMGYLLQQNIDSLTSLVSSDDTTLDTIKEIVDFIKLNRSTLENLTIGSIAGLSEALEDKVDKISGKGLSDLNYSQADKDKVDASISSVNLAATTTATGVTITNTGGNNANVSAATESAAGVMTADMVAKLNQLIVVGVTVNRNLNSTTDVLAAKALYDHNNSGDHDSRYYQRSQIDTLLSGKVDTVAGLGLSQNNFTDSYKSKLDGIQAGAQANVGTNITLNTSGNSVAIQSSTGTGGYIPLASTTNAGIITKEQHDKLASVQANAQVNVPTNLSLSRTGNTVNLVSSTGSNALLELATATLAGLMSTSDKAKLDGIQAGAQANVGTNLSGNRSGNTYTIISSTGDNVNIAIATTGATGLMSYQDKSKLDGIAAGAGVNPAITTSRTSTSTSIVLAASAMNDHVNSGDHDSRYVSKAGSSTVTGSLTINGNITVGGNAKKSNGETLLSSASVEKVEVLTQAQYDALTPVATTLYVIKE